MKLFYLLIAVSYSIVIHAQCDLNGNVIIYSNYDGGILNISVDQNIPNLKFGILSYEPVQVNFTGPYVSNISNVKLISYYPNSQGNNHCNLGILSSNVSGANTASVQIETSLVNGLYCGYRCDEIGSIGGCQSVTQIQNYFTTFFGGSLRKHYLQYDCWNQHYSICDNLNGNCCGKPNPNFTYSEPEISLSGDQYLCDGESVILTSSSSLNNTWSNGEISESISVNGAGLYSVMVDSAVCSLNGVAEIEIFSVSTPIISFEPNSDTMICSGELMLISQTTSLGDLIWSTNQQGSSITVITGGNYWCSITNDYGCTGYSDTALIMVNSLPNPQISGLTALYFGDSTQLFASGGETYSWQPPTGLSCIDCPNPIVQPEVSTQYTVTVTDSNGCVNTKTVFVNINTDGCIYIPNIFSPNKDQKNDEFCLYGSCLKSGTFTIYNRWGEKVFETNDITNCWDGTYKGEPVNSDVFVYKLNGVLVTGEVIEESGSIEVVR